MEEAESMTATAVRYVLVEYILLRYQEESITELEAELKQMIYNLLAHHDGIESFRKSLSRIVHALIARVNRTNAQFVLLRQQSIVDKLELSKNREQLVNVAVEEIIYAIRESENGKDQRVHNTVFKRLKTMSEKDLREITVASLAHSLGYGRNHFCVLAKHITGKPPSRLIREEKLRRAMLLLSDHKAPHTISEIAACLGFSSPKYFSAVFRHAFGFNPSELPSRTKSSLFDKEDGTHFV